MRALLCTLSMWNYAHGNLRNDNHQIMMTAIKTLPNNKQLTFFVSGSQIHCIHEYFVG